MVARLFGNPREDQDERLDKVPEADVQEMRIERKLVEKPVTVGRAEHDEPSEAEDAPEGAQSPASRLHRVEKPQTGQTPDLAFSLGQLASPLSESPLAAEHSSARKLLDAGYVLEPANHGGVQAGGEASGAAETERAGGATGHDAGQVEC